MKKAMQYGYTERRGLQHGADQAREVQLGTGENHHDDSNEIRFGVIIEPLQHIFSKKPDYVPYQPGYQMFLDHQKYAPDPVALRETPAAKLFFEVARAYYRC